MPITRKEFVGGAAAGTVVLLVQACGGGGSSYAGSPAPAPMPQNTCGSSGAQISGNHGHAFTVPSADLDSMVDKTYSIGSQPGHEHFITLTPSQLVTLKAHNPVTVTSTSAIGPAGAHTHDVTVTCV